MGGPARPATVPPTLKKPKLIVWPELSGNFILQDDAYLSYLHKQITSKGAELLLGTSYIDYSHNKNIFNIAFILMENSDATEKYRKQKIFPFSETEDYSSGKKTLTLSSRSGLGRVGVMICLESLYPDVAKNLVKEGAGILCLISADTSFGNSSIPYLHSKLIALRAVENNRYAIHVGNSGPSTVADNKGRIILEIPYGEIAYGCVDVIRLQCR
ncbi:nitrilase-related carbon-nitrogen hydrolase [Candidatus Margulisiibacteriota bacterium]